MNSCVDDDHTQRWRLSSSVCKSVYVPNIKSSLTVGEHVVMDDTNCCSRQSSIQVKHGLTCDVIDHTIVVLLLPCLDSSLVDRRRMLTTHDPRVSCFK